MTPLCDKRNFLRFSGIGAIAAVAMICSRWPGFAQSARRLPPIDAYDLSGAARRFPSGLPTALTLVVVAFERGQQSAADRMFKLADEVGTAKQGIATIETPVIEDPGSAGRFFIDNGMKSGIRDEEKRKIVVTLYVKDIKAWLAETGLVSTDSVHLMAVTRSGRILRSTRAEAISDAEAMRQFIAEAKKHFRS